MSTLDAAKARLLNAIQEMRVPQLSPLATAAELRNAGAVIGALTSAVDTFLAEVGREIESCAGTVVDRSEFIDVLYNALENLLDEIERAAHHAEHNAEAA